MFLIAFTIFVKRSRIRNWELNLKYNEKNIYFFTDHASVHLL